MAINKITCGTSTGSELADSINELIGLFPDAANVSDYGAIGDGITNDTVAFNTAISENDLVVVNVTNDFYLLDRVYLTSNKTIIGINYPKLKLRGQAWGDTDVESAAIFMLDYTTENCLIQGFSLDGNKGSHTASTLFNVECVNLNGKRNTISFNRIFNAEGEGVDIDGVSATDNPQYNIVTYNEIYDCNGYGVHNSIGSSSNNVSNNNIRNCGHLNLRGGIDVFGSTLGIAAHGNNIITGNNLQGNYRNLNISGINKSAVNSNISKGGTEADMLTGAQLTVPSSGAVGSYAIMSKKTAGSVLIGDELTGDDLFLSNTSGSQLEVVSSSEVWRALSKSSGTGGALVDRQALYIRIS